VIERTQPLSFSLDETTDVGVDSGAPVTNDDQTVRLFGASIRHRMPILF
jgi:hypothetical protein